MSKYALTGLVTIFAMSVAGQGFSHADTFKVHKDRVLGTSFDLMIVSPEEGDAKRAEEVILSEIERLNEVFSLYQPSEIQRLNSTDSLQVSEELLEVWDVCENYRVETSQALSCRIGTLLNEWSSAEEAQSVPDRPELRIEAGEIRRVVVPIQKNTRTVSRPDIVRFNMDALAKGYIMDVALDAGRRAVPTAEGMLINVGGDVLAWGEGPHDGSWRVAVTSDSELGDGASAHHRTLHVKAGAVATSAQQARAIEIGGDAFGHIVSPADGWPVSHIKSATVYAASAVDADAFATALMVMELKDGLAFIESKPGVEAEIVSSDGRHHSTTGWSSLRDQSVSSAQGAPDWPKGYEFAVNFEIPEHNVADYERPYVAVWISDDERNLVRILMLAGEQDRWMEENYYWHRRFGRKAGSLVDAVSGPTRRPGEYTLKWDGLDDDGSPVPPGDYILHLEAAREHGGHQHERISFTLSSQAVLEQVEPGDELGPISVKFDAVD